MNLKDMSFEAEFTMDEEGMQGLVKFLRELDDETLDAIFSGKQGLTLHDPKRGTVELSRVVVRCTECRHRRLCDQCTEQNGKMYHIEYCSRGEREE